MAIKVAAKELAPDWHITGIMPSVVTDTEMTKNDIIAISSLREWPLEEVREKMIPMGANIVKADIAQMAYWLLFESPNVMTGSIVEVSAGV
jgi:NAD(P)-dependent dehydrogenase (short-subunit alcohol dehydrogenase family)